jgi:dTDP-4-amino-4,6-dideoxygalactose transaminase
MRIARRYKLFVVEDAAHGPGSIYKGRQIGTIGDIGCFSFFANKNMTTGEGGMVVSNNKDLIKRLKYLRSHGMTSLSWDRCKGRANSYDVIDLGYNYRFDEIRAALGLVQLAKLNKNNNKRRILCNNYIKLLKGVEEIRIPFLNRRQKVSCHIFPIILEDRLLRDRLQAHLALNNVQSSIHYPPAHLMKIYRKPKLWVLPVTEAAANRQLTLPLYPSLKLNDLRRIVKVIRCFFQNGNNQT